MQTIDETRRSRLLLLLKRFGTYADLNEALGWPRTDSRLSRIKNANTRSDRDGKVFQMGSPMAREIEAALGLGTGWMDTPPTYAEIHGAEDPRATLMLAMESMTMSQLSTAAALIQALKQTQNEEKGAA